MKWKQLTRAAAHTDGFLSVSACLMKRSMPCSIDGGVMTASALRAFGRVAASSLAASLARLAVTIIVSSANGASSLMATHSICRSPTSVLWNSFVVLKKAAVASVRVSAPFAASTATRCSVSRLLPAWIGVSLKPRVACRTALLSCVFVSDALLFMLDINYLGIQ